MKSNRPTNSVRLLIVLGLALCALPLLKADVVVLNNGSILTGSVLQQDDNGILIKVASGTFRYPKALVKDVRKEEVAAPNVSNNGERIPDWAQIVTLLAKNGWAQELKQVPAARIEEGIWKNVPYVSFSCRFAGYEINIFGDLDKPAAIQIGAMGYLKQSAEAKTNCINFICSVLANADDRKMVRALNWNQKDSGKNGEFTAGTVLPDERGSYGGWWVSVYSEKALAAARASDAELFALTQPAVATPQPATTTTQPAVTTTYPYYYNTVPAWTAEELAAARPRTEVGQAALGTTTAPATTATPATTAAPATTATTEQAAAAQNAAKAAMMTPNQVYPRSYNRADGTYNHGEARRR